MSHFPSFIGTLCEAGAITLNSDREYFVALGLPAQSRVPRARSRPAHHHVSLAPVSKTSVVAGACVLISIQQKLAA
ncbi:hypothetical protein CUJ84_Chr005024 [Rhizobium leguminosarum]|uniref:Uncharacterized protein n=1 Tax=Rhizobium leguminosarum TaxID=384 RepID=A0A2K9ZAM4_RHILE|nr:hypothetical protein CUJ84_Chr005024 [Rhizobium leguminosarum]